MHRFGMEAFTAAAVWAVSSTCLNIPIVARQDAALVGTCPHDHYENLGRRLSDDAKIYFPGSSDFETATLRWSSLENPKINVVVVPATERDVSLTVKFANMEHLPFLAYNTRHGAITTLGRMDHGIEIFLDQLSSVEVSRHGRTAKIGGGTSSKKVVHDLWAAGKQAVTGTCECVSLMGPALGGGHGWLQGRHGLVSDQFVSMNVVLANGDLTTIDSSSDLWWAMRGAGHNFGIVTSVTTKVYDIEHPNWAIETIIFSGDKVEALYQAANDHLLKNGTQAVDVINWSYWLNIPPMDAEKPVIMMYIIQEGVDSVDPIYTQPFHDIGPLSVEPISGTYLDLAGWTGIADTSPPCQKAGANNPRFPIYLESYNVEAQKTAYDLFASAAGPSTAFSNSIFMFEGYSQQGVQAIRDSETAFAFRGEHLLNAPLLSYMPAGKALDDEAAQIGNELRDILHRGSGRSEMNSYINYAFGNEGPESWYGNDRWRQRRLRNLKDKYDPRGKFSFFGPIA